MNGPKEQQSAPVPRFVGAKQVEESPRIVGSGSRWAWAEPSVWTARMLQALEQGLKGGIWFSLIDKVYNRSNLWSSWSKVAANKGAAGVDDVTVKQYERHVEKHIGHLTEELRAGTYWPKAIRRCYIPKPGSAQGRPAWMLSFPAPPQSVSLPSPAVIVSSPLSPKIKSFGRK